MILTYVITIFLAVNVALLLWILLFIHNIKHYIIISNNGKHNEEITENEEQSELKSKVKGIDKISTYKPEDFDKHI